MENNLTAEQWQAIAEKLAEYLETYAADTRYYFAREWFEQAKKELGYE